MRIELCRKCGTELEVEKKNVMSAENQYNSPVIIVDMSQMNKFI